MSTQACFKIHLIYQKASQLMYLIKLMFLLIPLELDLCLRIPCKAGQLFLSTACGLILERNLSLFPNTLGKVMHPLYYIRNSKFV